MRRDRRGRLRVIQLGIFDHIIAVTLNLFQGLTVIVRSKSKMLERQSPEVKQVQRDVRGWASA